MKACMNAGMKTSLSVLLAAGLTLTGCGGGSESAGGQDVSVDISYSGADGLLFAPLLVVPVILGLAGNTPHCTLASGSLPPGVTVEDGCTLVGTPSAPGSFDATIDLRVAGVGTSFSVVVHSNIAVPALAVVRTTNVQPPDRVLAVNATVDEMAVVSLQNFEPQDDVRVSYAQVDGALPAGLALNSMDGTLSGVTAARGRYTFSLVATLSEGALGFNTAAQQVVIDVQ
jgi:hypothetical protein